MLRIYCDKNIYSSIKPGKNNFIPQLKQLMDGLQGKMVFTYSTAHHDDLANSDKSYWDEDLVLMEKYVEDNYFYYNPITKNTEIYLARPRESFYDMDHVKETDIEQIVENLFDDLDEPFSNLFKSLMNNILNLKLPDIGETLKTEKDRELFKKYEQSFPEKNRNTLKDFFQWGSKLLTEKEEVKKLKKMMEEYSSSDNYSFERWADNYDEKFRDRKSVV